MTTEAPAKQCTEEVLRAIIIVRGRNDRTLYSSGHSARDYLATRFGSAAKTVMLCDSASPADATDSLHATSSKIEAGEIDVVVTTDVDRVSRSSAAARAFIELCVRCDVRFIAFESDIDTGSPDWQEKVAEATA